LTGLARVLASLTVALSLDAHARGAGIDIGVATPQMCDIAWALKPQNGTPHATKFVVHMAPNQTTTLRVRGPNGWGQTRRGWGLIDATGARCIVGATCRFDHALGSAAESSVDAGSPVSAWSASEAWQAGTASGVSIAAGRHFETLFDSLAADAPYSWQVECLQGNVWTAARLGVGNVRTLPAAGAAAELRLIVTSDWHYQTSYHNLVKAQTTDATDDGDEGLCLDTDADPSDGITGTAYLPYTACSAHADCAGLGSETCSCATDNTTPETVEDCTVNGVPDYREEYERNQVATQLIARIAGTFNAHALIDLGDTSEIHVTGASSCDTATSPIGPCIAGPASYGATTLDADANDPEVRTQLQRPLGFDTAEAAGPLGVGQEEYFDDTLLFALNRRAFAQNRLAPITRRIPVIFKDGNHEDLGLLGTETSVFNHYNPPYTAADAVCNGTDDDARTIDPTCSGQGLQAAAFSNTEREHNPNDFYPNGLLRADYSVTEETGEILSFAAGQACLLFVDEYLYTTGLEHEADLFGIGTTFDDANCNVTAPVKSCFGGLIKSSGAPSTPYEWNLAAQIDWIDATALPACVGAGAGSLVRFSHHAGGALEGQTGDRYFYGRGACPGPARHCLDSVGSPVLVDAGIQARVPELGLGETIPCWEGIPSETSDSWCNWVYDDNHDDDGHYCSPVDWQQLDPKVDETELKTAIDTAISGGDFDHAIHLFGHDHEAYLCDLYPNQTYAVVGQPGQQVSSSWQNNQFLREMLDFDGNGIPDYRESDLLEELSALGLPSGGAASPRNSGVIPGTGWQGKSFATVRVSADGTTTLEIRDVAGFDACYGTNNPNCPRRQAQDGRVVVRKLLTP
jgi:hypothetical protein